MKIELWDDFATLQRQMDDVFGDFFAPRARSSVTLRRPFVPVTDVYERDGKRMIRVELPGIDPTRDLSVTVEDGYLVIKGTRERREEVKDEDVYRMESFAGEFRRYFPIPKGIVEKDITAEYVDGVLEITVPAVAQKPLGTTTTTIPVHTGVVRKEKVA